MDIIKIVFSTLVSLTMLFILTKLMGNRQMSQLSMFDYISSIAIGSVAGEMAVMSTDSILEPLVSMIIFALSSITISLITCKSIILRRFFEGQAFLLYQDGQIYEKNLLRAKMDVDELLSACRLSGYFDLEEVQSVFLEVNGKISVLPLSRYRPATPSDFDLSPIKSVPLPNVIIDGKILPENLKSTRKSKAWLMKELERKEVPDIKEVFLATYDPSKDTLNVYLKYHKKMLRDIFE